MVKFGGILMLSTDITVEISGITTVLPVVIPPNFTADFHWYTTVNTTGLPLLIPLVYHW